MAIKMTKKGSFIGHWTMIPMSARKKPSKRWQCIRILGGAAFLLLLFGNYYCWSQMSSDDKNISMTRQQPNDFLMDSRVHLQKKSKAFKPKPDVSPKRLLTFANVTVSSDKEDVARFSPPLEVMEISSFQMDSEVMFIVGGFYDSHNRVTRRIQFFNISSQRWMPERNLEMPPGVAETHQGLAFEPITRMLYVISGQVGAGCLSATTKSIRIHLDTGKVDNLPPLPAARYSPGAGVVPHPKDPSIIHLHVFGGASEIRNRTVTNHWRLIVKTNDDDMTVETSAWEELDPVLDAGVHGSGIQYKGYIYYTAFCAFENGRYLGSERTIDCHKDGNPNQLLRHTVDSGYFLRYPTAFADTPRKEWERLPDIPFPICHSTAMKFSEKIFFFAGGETVVERKRGVASPPFNGIQVFDLQHASWDLITFPESQKMSLNNPAVWIDEKKGKVYGHRVKHALISGDIVEATSFNWEKSSKFEGRRQAFITRSRSKATKAFSSCIKTIQSHGVNQLAINITTIFDKGYDDVRVTWNQRNFELQLPDIIAFPQDALEVSTLIHCAVKAGYHVCGRNGRHSIDGDTCTHGIVIDVSKIRQIRVLDPKDGVVQVGAGMHAGQIAIELERFNLTLPMGQSTSLGITGMVLSGGQGPLTRHYGMTSDFLEWIQLVDHNGKIINATAENEYSDYLWLARGGGSGVLHFPGIITSLQFRGVPMVPARSRKVWTKFRIKFDANVYSATELLMRWQEIYVASHLRFDSIFSRLTMEPRLVLLPFKDNDNNSGFRRLLFLECSFFGDDVLHDEFADRMLPQIMRVMKGGTMSDVDRLENLKFYRSLSGQSFDQLVLDEPEKDPSKLRTNTTSNRWKSYSSVATGLVPREAFYFLAQTIFEAQPLSPRLTEIKPLGGAIQKISKIDSAFWHRNASWWALTHYEFSPNDSTEFAEQVLSVSEGRSAWLAELMGHAFTGKYVGYIDRSNSTGRDLELCYGNNYQTIVNIKKRRDPHNVFRTYIPNSLKNAPFRPLPPPPRQKKKQ